MDFFRFILFGVYSVSWICKSVSFGKLGEFSVIISLNTLLHHSFVIVSQVPKSLYIFFFSLFSLCWSDLVNSTVLSSNLLIFCYLHSTI